MHRNKNRNKIVKKKLPPKLKKVLGQVCSQGFVKFNGKWYCGHCSRRKKLNCNLCDFAGCEVEHSP